MVVRGVRADRWCSLAATIVAVSLIAYARSIPNAWPDDEWSIGCWSAVIVLMMAQYWHAGVTLIYAGRRTSLALPIVTTAVLASTSFCNWPLRLRFELSRSQLEAAAESGARAESPAAEWIGLYRVRRVESQGMERPCFLVLDEDDLRGTTGLAYYPGGAPSGMPLNIEGKWAIYRMDP